MANHLRRKDGKHEDHEEKEKRRPEERPQRCCKAGYNKPKLLEHAEHAQQPGEAQQPEHPEDRHDLHALRVVGLGAQLRSFARAFDKMEPFSAVSSPTFNTEADF